MKIYSVALIGCIVMFSGCSSKTNVVTKDVLVPTEVRSVVPCVTPKVECDFGTGKEDTSVNMLKCIIDQKRALEACSGN